MATFSSDEGESFEIDQILDTRKRGTAVQYLVRWKGYESEDNSWESARHLVGAGDAIDKFKKEQKLQKQKTPTTGKRKSTKQVEKKVEKSVAGSRSVTQTTVTKVETRTLSGAQSESSSPESSPRLTRRSTFTSHVTKQSNSTQPKRGKTCSDLLQLCKMDLPIIIFLACLLFIILTFIVQPSKK